MTVSNLFMKQTIPFIYIAALIKIVPVNITNKFIKFLYIFRKIKSDKWKVVGFKPFFCILFKESKIRKTICDVAPEVENDVSARTPILTSASCDLDPSDQRSRSQQTALPR